MHAGVGGGELPADMYPTVMAQLVLANVELPLQTKLNKRIYFKYELQHRQSDQYIRHTIIQQNIKLNAKFPELLPGEPASKFNP